MDRTAWLFIVLLVVLFLGSVMYKETFIDASDNSANTITLSLSDLFSLFGQTRNPDLSAPAPAPARAPAPAPAPAPAEPSLDSQYISDLRTSIVDDVRQTVRAELESRGSQDTVLNDSCIDSMANQQGSDFMRYIPGKNPADYIRKDSVPCYGCSLPN